MPRIILVFALGVLLLSAPLCIAKSVEREHRESSHTEMNSAELDISSTSASNEVKFQIRGWDHLSMEVSFGQLNGTGESDSELEFSLSLAGVGEYPSVSNTTELSFVDFASGVWEISAVLESNGMNEVTASWQAANGSMTTDVTFTWANTAFSVHDPASGKITVPPSAVKWTVAIENYPYTSTGPSVVGLTVMLDSDADDHIEEGNGSGLDNHGSDHGSGGDGSDDNASDDNVSDDNLSGGDNSTESDDNVSDDNVSDDNVSDDNVSGNHSSSDHAGQGNVKISSALTKVKGLFSWATSATVVVDGVNGTAAVTVFRKVVGGGSHDLIFIFDAIQPSSIIWDPVVGAVGAATSLMFSGVLLLLAGLLLL
jgi:hypothetical protein